MSQHGPPAGPLYDRIEEIRIRRGLTKMQVARAVGVNRQTIANLETQPRAPMAATVKQIADALGVDLDEAIRLAGIPLSSVDAAETAMEERVAELEREVAGLREELRRANGGNSDI